MPWMANYNPSRDDSLPLHSTVLRTTTGYSVPVLRRCNPSINSRSRTVNASVIPPSLTDPGYVLTNHHIPILIKLNLYGMLVRIYFALHAALWDLGSLSLTYPSKGCIRSVYSVLSSISVLSPNLLPYLYKNIPTKY